jgi:hypothetical protein
MTAQMVTTLFDLLALVLLILVISRSNELTGGSGRLRKGLNHNGQK